MPIALSICATASESIEKTGNAVNERAGERQHAAPPANSRLGFMDMARRPCAI